MGITFGRLTSATTLKNLFIRSISLAARFLLIFNLSHYHGDSLLGEFGIFNSTVILSVLLLGFDIYNFANRELIVTPTHSTHILFNQAIFYAGSYLICFLPLLSLFFFDVLPFHLAFLFFIILCTEHLNQELYRLMTILQMPIQANFALFIRSGLWVILVFAHQILLKPDAANLDYVYVYWLGGGTLCLVYSLTYVLRRVKIDRSQARIDLPWIKQAVKISSLYFFSTISYNFILYGNRFIIDFYRTKEEVGIYTFYNQIANLINVLVFTTIIMEEYPHIVKLINEKDRSIHERLRTFNKKIFLLSGIIAVGMIVSSKYAFTLIGRETYALNVITLYILIISNVILNISFSSHYVLYGLKKDKLLLRITCLSLVIYFCVNFVGVYTWGMTGAAVAVLASCLALFILKKLAARKLLESFNSPG